jgi:hypothetical protein
MRSLWPAVTLIFLGALLPASIECQGSDGTTSPLDFWRQRRAGDSLANLGSLTTAESLYRLVVPLDTADVVLWLSLANTALALHELPAAESAFIHVFKGQYFAGATAAQIARIEAQRHRKRLALDWLDSAMTRRFPRTPVSMDSAFLPYRDDPRFRAIAGLLPRRSFSRDEGWRYDVAFFVSEARRLHVGFARPAFSARFGAAAEELLSKIPRLTDDEILAALQHLTTLLGDGHSGVYIRTLPKSHRRLPVDFYWFADGMYIVDARLDHRDLIGSRVLRIGKMTPASLRQALEAYVPRDNPMRILAVGIPFEAVYPFQLRALGAIDDTANVQLVVTDRSGTTREVNLRADDTRPPQARLPPRDTGSVNPLWLRRPTTNIWMSRAPELAGIYVQYNACADAPGTTISGFSEELRTALKDTGVVNLVIDVRRNGGGNSFLNLPLQQVIFAFAEASIHHRVWVLAGRHTFSAAQNFVNYIERFTGAIFVGEPTGSAPNFTGENTEVLLPFSGVIADISNENHYSAFWEDQRPWIAPTIPVTPTASDYFANRDPVLAAVGALIRHSE